MSNWHTYQGAVLWTKSPLATPPTFQEAKSALKAHHAFLARWTSDFDCAQPTQWWYCICDHFTPLNELSAKQRYRIKKGLDQCNIQRITNESLTLNEKEIAQVLIDSFMDYPAKYRPDLSIDKWIAEVRSKLNDPEIDVWLASDKQKGELIGYGYCTKKDDIVYLNQIKVPTKYLAKEVNAAFAYTLCEYYLQQPDYRMIIDGERNIKHETKYQDFLVRVINFRYAYCRLNIVYSPLMKCAVYTLYPFRRLFELIGKKSALFYNVYCILKQEEIRRSFNEKNK